MTTADFAAGSIFIVRDFAQHEIKHYILLAMLVGGTLTYFLSITRWRSQAFLHFLWLNPLIGVFFHLQKNRYRND